MLLKYQRSEEVIVIFSEHTSDIVALSEKFQSILDFTVK